MAFFHGVETIQALGGTTPVQQIDSAVIGLVGIAPQGPINTLTLCANKQDTEQFGGELYPMTINVALRQIYQRDPGAKVLVVNVYDPSTMSTTITEEAVTISNGKGQLDNVVLSEAATPVVAGGSPWETYEAGTDYTINEYGVIKIIPSGGIAEGDTIYVTYDTIDVSGLASADFVGTTSPARTGFKLFTESFDSHGFNPKIFVCPQYSNIDAVANEMETQADTFRAFAVIDDVQGKTRTQLIANRTTSGNSFATTSRRVLCVGPWIKDYDHNGSLAKYPYSSAFVGVMSHTARTLGYWESPSNKSLGSTVVAPEYVMTGTGINDQSGDYQLLNAAGITTLVKVGGGYRTFGNRSAAYPSDTDVHNFIPIQWVDNVVDESLEKTVAAVFLDKPINQATIDAIVNSANAFFSSLIQRGAILPGSRVYYDPADNPAVDIAAGRVRFRKDYASPTPAERITFISTFDINLLTQLS